MHRGTADDDSSGGCVSEVWIEFQRPLKLQSAWIIVYLVRLIRGGSFQEHGHGVAGGQQGWNWILADDLGVIENMAQIISASQTTDKQSGSSSWAKYKVPV